LAGLLVAGAAADEGMWLFNQAPAEKLRRDYQFDLKPEWLDHLMKSSVRFNNGGSGAFVSQDGLVVTNHHIGTDSLQKLSKPGRDLVQLGFVARNLQEEAPCPDLELNVLQSIEDVTARVEASLKPGMTDEQAANARRSFISSLEKSEAEKSGLRCDVVTLYLGGAYHLYRYKKYTDVRLVMAPEQGAAFFGGDADNFEYPRYDFDVCFFRVYENGKPLRGIPYLKWNAQGVKAGDLVFVSGHPGRTNRLETLARLEHLRDHTLPFRLAALRNQEMALRLYSQRGPEQRRQAQSELYGVANARKAYSGQYFGLLDQNLMDTKKNREQAHRQAVAQDARWNQEAGPAWESIRAAQSQLREYEKEYYLLEQRLALQGTLFEFARHLARWSQEKGKPNGDRLREYRDSNLDSLWQEVLSPADLFPELEMAQLTASLSFAAEILGGTHPTIQTLLAGKSPEARAQELVSGSSLTGMATRKRYRDMSTAELKAQGDPLIDLALALDEASRKVRRRYELEVSEPELRAYGSIARSQFALQGKDLSPDATFTLRLSYGKVGGYREGRRTLPFATTLGEAFACARQHGNEEPFRLPKRWWDGEKRLYLKMAYDFVSTADTIGGNSGSPVVNRQGEVVGVNFDRNRHGLSRNFLYTDLQARHISVHSPVVLHLLEKLYGGQRIVSELRSGKLP
jgi:hypothetical protein